MSTTCTKDQLQVPLSTCSMSAVILFYCISLRYAGHGHYQDKQCNNGQAKRKLHREKEYRVYLVSIYLWNASNNNLVNFNLILEITVLGVQSWLSENQKKP